jgi:hypothetical protein
MCAIPTILVQDSSGGVDRIFAQLQNPESTRILILLNLRS